ncbi:hypothetical protein H0E87_000253 [Populus deltoides]|uniref:Sodium/calcium exchanger membrane region domain-containing protein n=1 Tax=Populus deltoides TaxID=3696 RepID=A0A8T2ZL43_POPDE|nr:hypothetical protein H0E87_000253 [Populus deltoides]
MEPERFQWSHGSLQLPGSWMVQGVVYLPKDAAMPLTLKSREYDEVFTVVPVKELSNGHNCGVFGVYSSSHSKRICSRGTCLVTIDLRVPEEELYLWDITVEGYNYQFVPSSMMKMSTVAASVGSESKEGLRLLVKGGPKAQKVVGIWLFGSAAWVFSMVIPGGATRLTRSGLSMNDWKFTGGLPPLSDEDWLIEFEKYQQSPEYKIPFALGVGQGLIGWWVEPASEYAQPRVSPHCFAAHLTSAFVIYSELFWTALSFVMPEPPTESLAWVRVAGKVKRLALPVSHIVGITAISGAFVAGNDAGHAFSTFPKMGDTWIPDDIFDLKPVIHNSFKNTSAVQMGTLAQNGSPHEFEEQSLFSPELGTQKMQPGHISEYGSAPGGFQPGVSKMWRIVVYKSIKTVIFSNKLNVLIPFGPLAILVHILTGHNGLVFLLSLLGIIPLAERLGYATEQLAVYTGPTIGGLLNATFGNATELIIAIYALRHGMIRVVQLSLLGSILSNMLLVLGCAFFCGGLVFYRKEQVFNKATATVNSGLLLMAVMGLLFPAVLHYTHTEVHYGKSELALSRFSSCIMLGVYAAYLYFQLKTQKDPYIPLSEEGSQNGENDNDDDETPEISKWESVFWLSIMTAWISILSEYLVDAIEGTSHTWNIPISFIGVILLPIVGNAAEHAGAIMFAMKDKLDISLGVAIGSSTQISMFGIPFCVVIGWIMGQPMDLNFKLFETATLFITVIVVAFFLQEGSSNYFKGLMLILCYVIVAASFFVHEDPPPEGKP